MASSRASSSPRAGTSAVNTGAPSVSVPVLSKATVSTRCARSSAEASLTRMPWRAATPVPAITATGVASPSAQGQANTSTETAWISAVSVPLPASSQPTSAAAAISSTTGTNTAATRSTSRWIGALAACASSTSRMMRASTLSAPTARTSSTSRSPTSSSATGTSTSCSTAPRGLSRCATSGRNCCSARIAAVACRLARASSHLPSSTSAMTTAEASKYRCGCPCPACSPVAARHQSHSDSPKAALVPSATSRSMLPVRAFNACQPAR